MLHHVTLEIDAANATGSRELLAANRSALAASISRVTWWSIDRNRKAAMLPRLTSRLARQQGSDERR